MDDPMRAWCRGVAKYIRFRYDRAAVEEELYLHLEESRDDRMEAEGLSKEAAEAEAIAAMGDPVALGKELDQVHGPLLGWTGRLSRWLVIWLAVFLGVWTFCFSPTPAEGVAFWFAAQLDPTLCGAWFTSHGEEHYTMPDVGECVAEVDGGTVTAGVYTISVWDGELRRRQLTDDMGIPYDYYEMTVFLRINAPPWRKFPYGLHQTYAVDSQGNVFSRYGDDRPDAVGDLYFWTSSLIEGNMPAWTKVMQVFFSAPVTESWSPQWVELRLPEEIGDFTLRLNLNYQEVAP